MFDLKTDLPNTHIHTFNPTSQINQRWANTNIESRVRRTSENYENYRNQRGLGLQLRPEDPTEDDDGGDESGVSSPPLWKNSYKYLSPNSRTQAIARGQWELMEMVKTMPESCYELSLKDIVEHQHRVKPESEEHCLVDEKIMDRKPSRGVKREEGKVKMMRTRSGESNHGGGLLLKMAFPFSLGARKKKKKNLGTNSFSRVSPRPEGLERSGKGGHGEKEWWKKRFSGSSGSESGGGGSGNSGSGGSSSSSGRKMSGCLPNCWSFLTKRNKKVSN